MELINKKENLFFWSFIILTVIAGTYFRLKGLGKWPLAVDEYYIVKSSENILKYGVPKWDAGGYYVRGLPLQYLTTLLLLIGIKAEFASRIIPVIANLIALPALYLIARKTSSKFAAGVVIFIFSFSIWEIEFARFARMYTMFQTIFIWYLYFFVKTIIENDRNSIKWLWILSFICIFIYEGSIFLVILNFLTTVWDRESKTINPFAINNYKDNIVYFLICIGILLFAYEFLTFDFRTLYSSNLLPPDILQFFKSKKTSSIFRLPVLLIQSLPSYPMWNIFFIIPLSASIFLFYKIIKHETSTFIKTASAIVLIFSLLNLIGLVIIFFLIFITIKWLDPYDIKRKFFKFLIIAGLANFIFWFAFAASTTVWYTYFPNVNIASKLLAVKLSVKESLNYPYLYETFVLFRDTIPIITYFIIFLLIMGVIDIFKNYNKDFINYRFLFFLLLFLLLIVSILSLAYFETRYFFFLYPLILILNITTIKRITSYIKRRWLNNLALGIIVIVILVFSEDFNLNYLLTIDSKEINFRKDYKYEEALHYYPRGDIRTPAEIINKESLKNDIIITNEQSCDYYLNRLNYVFKDFKGTDFPGESVSNGNKERWTNANLIYKYPDLYKVIDNNHQRVWLLLNTMWGLKEFDSLIEKYEKYLYYKSVDGYIHLYMIYKNNSFITNHNFLQQKD